MQIVTFSVFFSRSFLGQQFSAFMHDLRGFSVSKSRDLVEKAFNEAIIICRGDKVSQPPLSRKSCSHHDDDVLHPTGLLRIGLACCEKRVLSDADILWVGTVRGLFRFSSLPRGSWQLLDHKQPDKLETARNARQIAMTRAWGRRRIQFRSLSLRCGWTSAQNPSRLPGNKTRSGSTPPPSSRHKEHPMPSTIAPRYHNGAHAPSGAISIGVLSAEYRVIPCYTSLAGCVIL